MKKLVFLLSVTFALVGCFKNDDDDDGYSNVYSGVVIFDNAIVANIVAMDGVSVAMRLAILLQDMENNDIEFTIGTDEAEPDWTELGNYTYPSGSGPYNIKELLFGVSSGVSLKKVSDELYTIEYGNSSGDHTAGYHDKEYRKGLFSITTGGIDNILDTSAESRWHIAYGEDGLEEMSYAMEYTYDSDITSEGLVSSIYYDGEKFIYDGEYSGKYTSLSTDLFTWSAEGYVKIEDMVDLSYKNTIDKNYIVSILSGGESLQGNEITYSTVNDPLIYTPDDSYFRAVGGTAIATINSDDTSLYPSSTVKVESTSNGEYIVYYNGSIYYEEL